MGLDIHTARGIVVKNLKTEKVERPSIMIQLTGNLTEKSLNDYYEINERDNLSAVYQLKVDEAKLTVLGSI